MACCLSLAALANLLLLARQEHGRTVRLADACPKSERCRPHFSARHAAYRRGAASSPLPPIIVLAAAVLARRDPLGVRIAPVKGAEEVVQAAARDADIVRALAHREAALWLIVQHHDELRAIVSLAVQRLVRDDERGSRQCGRRDAIKHVLRDADAVERALGVVRAIDRDRRPAQTS